MTVKRWIHRILKLNGIKNDVEIIEVVNTTVKFSLRKSQDPGQLSQRLEKSFFNQEIFPYLQLEVSLPNYLKEQKIRKSVTAIIPHKGFCHWQYELLWNNIHHWIDSKVSWHLFLMIFQIDPQNKFFSPMKLFIDYSDSRQPKFEIWKRESALNIRSDLARISVADWTLVESCFHG